MQQAWWKWIREDSLKELPKVCLLCSIHSKGTEQTECHCLALIALHPTSDHGNFVDLAQLGLNNVLSTSTWKAPCKEKLGQRNFLCLLQKSHFLREELGCEGGAQLAVCFPVRVPHPGTRKTGAWEGGLSEGLWSCLS